MLTPQQRQNVETFLRYWETVPEANVFPKLAGFRAPNQQTDSADCRTIACAGGWLPFMPEFAAMGVYPDEYGAPLMKVGPKDPWGGMHGYVGPWELARRLFGREYVFAGRYFHEQGSDKDVVRARFEKLLKE